MTSAFIEIRDIKKQYGPITAVKDVTLDIRKGEFMTFLGPSGSGKSTTLYMLAGFEYPTAGDIRLNGKTLLDTPSHKRNIGMVFQRYTLFPHLTVGENVAFPLRIRRLPKADVERKVKEALRLVRLEGFEDRKPALMSGGQQQRVALARALVYDPPVLLMDEPLSALDKKLREEIQFEIRRIHQETGVTILYVTHDQEEALRLSDRIAVFSQGGSTRSVPARPSMPSRPPASSPASSAIPISSTPRLSPSRAAMRRLRCRVARRSPACHSTARVRARPPRCCCAPSASS